MCTAYLEHDFLTGQWKPNMASLVLNSFTLEVRAGESFWRFKLTCDLVIANEMQADHETKESGLLISP